MLDHCNMEVLFMVKVKLKESVLMKLKFKLKLKLDLNMVRRLLLWIILVVLQGPNMVVLLPVL